MTAVLVDSRKKGASAKVAVRDAVRLRGTGLNGDRVRLVLFNEEVPLETHEFAEDFEIEIGPYNFVKAEHLIVGKGRVYIDMLRK